MKSTHRLHLIIIFIILVLLLVIIFTLRFNYTGQKNIIDLKQENNPQFWVGNDTIFLLIHGFASGPQEMKFLGNYLNQKGYSAKTIVLRGHNENPLQLEDIKWENWEHQVQYEIRLLNFQHYKNIYVIGFSLGGLLAIRTSTIQHVKGVIAISPCLYIFNKAFYIAPLHAFMKAASFFTPYFPRKADKYYIYNKNIYQRIIYDEISLDSVGEVLVLADSTKKILSKVKKPLLLIHAKDDKTVDPASSVIISQQVKTPIKQLEMLSHGGHLIVLNDTRDQVFDLIYRFVRYIDATEKSYETTNR